MLGDDYFRLLTSVRVREALERLERFARERATPEQRKAVLRLAIREIILFGRKIDKNRYCVIDIGSSGGKHYMQQRAPSATELWL
ncbi:hypothetical protein SPSIL_048820 [Sporomusa silvacetica DSM 10669]|uniref:Uncharacterized protein n=1 Tax=Sporomusa silvacetica DSM 10669 TaxID=1123289 RepID=A0ABZ3ISM5_9FIRM|nr:hypothetical protein [Sporomusa silvacetica]OZC14651.1 hypothetical protein SPSIL_48020 [Sporomusa silvacetica DSM 10669]